MKIKKKVINLWCQRSSGDLYCRNCLGYIQTTLEEFWFVFSDHVTNIATEITDGKSLPQHKRKITSSWLL